jgi:predicted nucleic acid-binding protein
VIVLDASVWISALSPTELRHVDSQRWLLDWFRQSDSIVVPVLFLAEVSGAVSRRSHDAMLAADAMNDILQSPHVTLVEGERSFGLHTASVAAAVGLRGADATYVALADLLRAPLVTWDREQLSRGALLIETREPSTDR